MRNIGKHEREYLEQRKNSLLNKKKYGKLDRFEAFELDRLEEQLQELNYQIVPFAIK